MARLWRNDTLRWAAPLAWMAFIFYLSAQPALPNLTPGLPSLQEIGGHLFVYFVLALLWRRTLAAAGVRQPARWALAIVALYGISDEFHQSFVPHRAPTFSDWVLDVAGGSAALLGSWWAAAIRRR